jgi:hypothetical protein
MPGSSCWLFSMDQQYYVQKEFGYLHLGNYAGLQIHVLWRIIQTYLPSVVLPISFLPLKPEGAGYRIQDHEQPYVTNQEISILLVFMYSLS